MFISYVGRCCSFTEVEEGFVKRFAMFVFPLVPFFFMLAIAGVENFQTARVAFIRKTLAAAVKPQQNPFVSLEIHVFWICFQGLKKQKSSVQGFGKTRKSTSKFIKNDFCEKSNVAIPSMRKHWFVSPKRRNFDSEIDKKGIWKQARKQMTFQGSWTRKS